MINGGSVKGPRGDCEIFLLKFKPKNAKDQYIVCRIAVVACTIQAMLWRTWPGWYDFHPLTHVSGISRME